MASPLDFGPFLALSGANRARLFAGSARATFAAGEALMVEGEAPRSVLAVIAGRLRIAQGTPPKIVATPSAPVVIGEMALLSGQPRNATVTAVTQVRAYRIPATLFTEVVAAEPEFARQLASFAAIRSGNNFLRHSSPFADLPATAIEALAAKLEPAEFAPGGVLMREGDRGDDAFLIRAGDVDVSRADRVIATLGAGAFVGEVSALTGSARTATVRARGSVSAFRLRGVDVRPIVKKHKDLVALLEGTMQSRHVPHRSGEVVVAPAPDDANAVLLRDALGTTYLRVTQEALAIYNDIDGERTLRDLAMNHFERTGALDPASPRRGSRATSRTRASCA